MVTSRNYVIFVVFFIVIMIFSSLVVFFNNENPTSASNPNAQPNNPSTPSGLTVDFRSGEFDAEVSEIFPQLVIVGQTEEYNIERIEAEIAKLQGFQSFRSSNYVGSLPNLSYRAEIILVPGSIPSDFFFNLSKSSAFLSNLQGVAVGLVELPSVIEVSNSDLNLSKKFIPPQHFSTAFLPFSIRKGDSIVAILNVSLANEVPLNIQVFECSIVSSPRQFLLKDSGKISSLQKELLVQGSMNSSNYLDENELRAGLQSVEFSILNISVMPFDANNPSSFFLDLNLSSENSKPAFDFLSKFFSSKGIDFSAFQPSSVEMQSIFIPDLNKTLALDYNFVEVQAKPGRSVGDVIDFNIFLYVQCGKILQVQGSE